MSSARERGEAVRAKGRREPDARGVVSRAGIGEGLGEGCLSAEGVSDRESPLLHGDGGKRSRPTRRSLARAGGAGKATGRQRFGAIRTARCEQPAPGLRQEAEQAPRTGDAGAGWARRSRARAVKRGLDRSPGRKPESGSVRDAGARFDSVGCRCRPSVLHGRAPGTPRGVSGDERVLARRKPDEPWTRASGGSRVNGARGRRCASDRSGSGVLPGDRRVVRATVRRKAFRGDAPSGPKPAGTSHASGPVCQSGRARREACATEAADWAPRAEGKPVRGGRGSPATAVPAGRHETPEAGRSR